MGTPIALDLPAYFQLLDELGIHDPIDRQVYLGDALALFEVFLSYQDEYRAQNNQKAEAEQMRRRANAQG